MEPSVFKFTHSCSGVSTGVLKLLNSPRFRSEGKYSSPLKGKYIDKFDSMGEKVRY